MGTIGLVVEGHLTTGKWLAKLVATEKLQEPHLNHIKEKDEIYQEMY